LNQTLPEIQGAPDRIPYARFLRRRNPLRVIDDARKKYDDIVHIRFGRSEYYFLVKNPELIEQVLITKQTYFGKENYIHVFIPTWKAWLNGLVTSTTHFESHDKQRKMEQPAFHQEKVNTYSKITTDIGERFISKWSDGKVLDIAHEMVELTTMIVAKCLFSIDIEAEAKEVCKDLGAFASYYLQLASPLAPLLVRLPSNKKYREAIKRTNKLIAKLVDERRKTDVDKGDLLSILLKAENDKGEKMTDEQLRDQICIFFVVGHETSAACLTWTYYLLSQNPLVEQKVHQEVDSLFPNFEVPKISDIPKLEYTLKVIYESMRIYPPSWSIVRQTMKDCYLGNYFLPARSNIWISQYLNHRDERFFPEPDRFLPERWTDDMKKKLPNFAYFPFGGGSRRCIGEPFAWVELGLLIATISRRWQMRLAHSHKVVPLPGVTLVPKYGMKMKLESR